MKSKKLMTKILEKRLDDICLKCLGEFPTMEPLFPGMPKQRIGTSCLSGSKRSAVKKEWDKYLKNKISVKRRMVKLEDFEKFDLCEGRPYPNRLDKPGFMTIGDPFMSEHYAVLDIQNEVAIKMLMLGYAPEV